MVPNYKLLLQLLFLFKIFLFIYFFKLRIAPDLLTLIPLTLITLAAIPHLQQLRHRHKCIHVMVVDCRCRLPSPCTSPASSARPSTVKLICTSTLASPALSSVAPFLDYCSGTLSRHVPVLSLSRRFVLRHHPQLRQHGT